MAEVIYVACPRCRKEFSVGPEFFTLPESYCHCPYCGNEFSVYAKSAPAASSGRGRSQSF